MAWKQKLTDEEIAIADAWEAYGPRTETKAALVRAMVRNPDEARALGPLFFMKMPRVGKAIVDEIEYLIGGWAPPGVTVDPTFKAWEQHIAWILRGHGWTCTEPVRQSAVLAWRPIETAPKDRLVIVYASPYEDLPGFVTVCQWHSDGGFCVCELRQVTHWMPLPPPPVAP